MDKSFLTDIKELRRRARSHIEQGAITAAYRGDRETVLRLLNESLATELSQAVDSSTCRPDSQPPVSMTR